MSLEIVSFFQTLLSLSLKAAVLILAILAIRALIGKRLPPAWRHALWGLVPLQLLLFVSLPSAWSVWNLWTHHEPVDVREVTTQEVETREVGDLSPKGHVAVLGDRTGNDTDSAGGSSRLSPTRPFGERSATHFALPTPLQIGIAVWLLGVAVMALIFLRQTLLCRRWLREAELVESEAVLHLFKNCAKKMKVRTWLVMAESRSVTGPLLIGAIRPALLLPHGLVESATPGQLQTVFLHELAHLKRWDVWTGWLMTFLLTLHWFNPLLWLAVRKMNADREEACDALALRSLEAAERSDYGRALIDIAQHFVTPSRTPGLVGISETGKNLKRRIEMLTHIGTWKLRWKILALAAVLLLGVTTMTDAQDQKPKRSAAEIQAEIDRLKGELAEAKETEKTVPSQPAADGQHTDDSNLPKNFPLLKFLGDYTGTEGDDPIDFQFSLLAVKKGDPDFDRLDAKEHVASDGTTYKISDSLGVFIYEGGLKPEKGRKGDDVYFGKLLYVKPNELELRIEKYFDDNVRDKPVPEALKSVSVKVIGEGENMILEIPKNAEWDKIRIERVKKVLPTAPLQQTPIDSPTGSYLGWEGDDRFGIVLGEAKDGVYPITIYEDGLPGKGFDPNDDDRYEGTATLKNGLKGGILEITLLKKFDENVEEPVEKALRKLTATVGSENGKATISIPKNREWDGVKVTKTVEPK